MLKIAFIGTHSTGKTLRAKKLSKEKGLYLVTESARSCPLPINKQASREAQLYIISTQLQREITQMHFAERFAANGIVCDRSLLDPLVYSLDRGYGDLVELLIPFTRKWMKTYSKLYWCRPEKGTKPVNDGVRYPDVMWQRRIDRRFETFIRDLFCLDVEVIDKKEETK